MTANTVSNGVLGTDYADGRKRKNELVFRYKTRACLVANLIAEYGRKTDGLNILDYGAAEGLTLLELDRLLPGNRYCGIEYSEELINRAPKLPDNIKLLRGDVTNLDDDVKRQKYDVVVALALLEHLKNPIDCLREAKFVMNAGGLLIATSPNPFWDAVSTRFGLLKGGQHETDMSRRVMIDIARKAGFEVAGFERFMWAPVSALPYLGLRISPRMSLRIDRTIARLHVLDFLFVNQVMVLTHGSSKCASYRRTEA